MTILWIIIILGLFMFLMKSGIIERYTSNMIGGADEGVSSEPSPTQAQSANEIIYNNSPDIPADEHATDSSGIPSTSDYQFPTRTLELGRDSGAEAGRGTFKIPSRKEIEEIDKGVEYVGPEGMSQSVPIPHMSTHNFIDTPQPTNETSHAIAPALTGELKAGMTIGANGSTINSDTPSLSQFKNIGVTHVNRLNNVSINYPNGLLGADAADDELQCISTCQNTSKCGMYSYQPKICHLYKNPTTGTLNQFLQKAPAHQTGILNRNKV